MTQQAIRSAGAGRDTILVVDDSQEIRLLLLTLDST
jgi:hypothetical protein